MQQFQPRGFSFLPVIVKNLLIINGIFFLATIVFERTLHTDLIDILGLHYLPSEKFQPFQFITYMFMHGSLGHIFFNMFAVWMFGSAIENLWGPKRFLIYYLITGIGAALIHYIILYFELRPVISVLDAYINNPSSVNLENLQQLSFLKISGIPSLSEVLEIKIQILNQPVIVGASGALFGLLLAFGMMFPNSVIYLYFAIPVKAKWFVIGYGAIELFSGVSKISGDNVAHFAHLGGMLFGFVLIKLWKINRVN